MTSAETVLPEDTDLKDDLTNSIRQFRVEGKMSQINEFAEECVPKPRRLKSILFVMSLICGSILILFPPIKEARRAYLESQLVRWVKSNNELYNYEFMNMWGHLPGIGEVQCLPGLGMFLSLTD